MIKIKATNVWPQNVDEAVFSCEEIAEYSGTVFITDKGQEIALIKVEFAKPSLDDESRSEILNQLGNKIKEMTQVTMKIEEVPPGSLPRFEYKARRWTDDRITGLDRVQYIEK